MLQQNYKTKGFYKKLNVNIIIDNLFFFRIFIEYFLRDRAVW